MPSKLVIHTARETAILCEKQAAVLLQNLRYGAPDSHIITVIGKDLAMAFSFVGFHRSEIASEIPHIYIGVIRLTLASGFKFGTSNQPTLT